MPTISGSNQLGAKEDNVWLLHGETSDHITPSDDVSLNFHEESLTNELVESVSFLSTKKRYKDGFIF